MLAFIFFMYYCAVFSCSYRLPLTRTMWKTVESVAASAVNCIGHTVGRTYPSFSWWNSWIHGCIEKMYTILFAGREQLWWRLWCFQIYFTSDSPDHCKGGWICSGFWANSRWMPQSHIQLFPGNHWGWKRHPKSAYLWIWNLNHVMLLATWYEDTLHVLK